jgi:hypothetical protein
VIFYIIIVSDLDRAIIILYLIMVEKTPLHGQHNKFIIKSRSTGKNIHGTSGGLFSGPGVKCYDSEEESGIWEIIDFPDGSDRPIVTIRNQKFNEYINRTRGNDDNGGDVGLFRLQD